MKKYIYLTIDDSPSKHMKQKVDFLAQRSIPAVFFCRGEFIPQHRDAMIYAIEHGYLLGNHSYSHPYFSKLSLEDCLNELIKTENLIEECYALSGIKRPYKVVRFPFGDKGTRESAQALQEFLHKNNFVGLDFTSFPDIDASWDWDTFDYKRKFIENADLYEAELSRYLQQNPAKKDVMLIHDFDNNHHLFEKTMAFLLANKVEFLPFNPFSNKN